MKLYLEGGELYVDTDNGMDLSVPIGSDQVKVKAWYLDDAKIEPVAAENFIGSVEAGASVNFRNIHFNPHAHGTHTESLGHITNTVYSVNAIKQPLFHRAKLVSILPQNVKNGTDIDKIITCSQIEQLQLQNGEFDALIIRTLPNTSEKRNKDYSHTNPCYFEPEIARIITDLGIEHLLVDLPSVDREEDEGVLAFHHLFWNVPENPNFSRTITEFIYVEDSILDGNYLLNLQVAPFENDASPSRPVLYKIFQK